MKFNLYSAIWMDPGFYIAVGVFALALFLLLFSIRKYLEIKNGSDFDGSSAEAEEIQGELPLEAEVSEPPAAAVPAAEKFVDPGQTLAISPEAAQAFAQEPSPAPAPRADAEPPHPSSKAEEFVKGLYQNMSSLDDRLKNIEAAFSKMNVNRDFTVTFLEDMISDYDSLDKEKIKARIEYLVADLKK